jgi:hypothetical protein
MRDFESRSPPNTATIHLSNLDAGSRASCSIYRPAREISRVSTDKSGEMI